MYTPPPAPRIKLINSSIPPSPPDTGSFIPPPFFNPPNRVIDTNTPHSPPPILTLLSIQSLPHAHRSQSEILADPRNSYITSSR
jgi:hypothetical protein